MFQAALGSVHPGATKFPSQPKRTSSVGASSSSSSFGNSASLVSDFVRPLLFGENGASGCINPLGNPDSF